MEMTMTMPLTPEVRTQLLNLHKALLRLHKVLLDDERKEYEKVHGTIATSGEVLNLVMYDKWFDWLHRISESIVRIDEITDDESPSAEDASDLLTNLRNLFRATEPETEFMTRYKASLQREPAAILEHIEVQRLLTPDA